jgi:hypothetical protein
MRRGTAEGALNTVEFLSWGDFIQRAGGQFFHFLAFCNFTLDFSQEQRDI